MLIAVSAIAFFLLLYGVFAALFVSVLNAAIAQSVREPR